MYGKHTYVDDRPTVIYCRESKDPNSQYYERIEVQRDILVDFCKKRGLVNIVDIIMDDDKTGTDFKRYEELLERVRRGEVEVVVFKDSSRLGRNQKESLILRDILMDEYNVEIIYESETFDDKMFGLYAWLNENRAREDSDKIRRVLKHKMETGKLLVKPFYGYRRLDKHTMVPDEETAKTVRWLFEEAAKGRGSGELASQLNAVGVPTPSQAAGTEKAASCWNAQHIRRILENPVYTGTMVHHRTSKKSFKNKKIVRHPKPEWIVHEAHHEPLVSQALFEEVQAARRHYKRDKYTVQNRPFSGLLRCGRCGSRLVLRVKKGRPDAYICGKNHREGAIKDDLRPDYGCRPHHVREDFLYEVTLRYMRALLEGSGVDVGGILRCLPQNQDNFARAEELEKKLSAVQRDIDAVYEDKLRGLIPEGLFLRKYRELSAREEELQTQLQEYREKIQKKPPKERLTDLKMGDIINRLDARTLTKEQLRLVFDCILVFEPGELREEDRERLGLSQEHYELLKTKGGLVFFENAGPAIGCVTP